MIMRFVLYLRCPTEGCCGTIGLKTFFAEAKVCEDNVALRVYEYVLRLQVPGKKKKKK